jgi:predicted phage-related endonuclease
MESNPYVNPKILQEAKRLDVLETGEIDTTNLPIVIDVGDMQSISNDEYIIHRRKGLGTSDSSIILGVNPYKNVEQLIAEKLSSTISEEERAIGKKSSVMKGKDLEPLIIKKWSIAADKTIIKPTPQYRHKDFEFLKFNFDGVSYDEKLKQYIPDEIKYVTYKGERHYNPAKEIFNEDDGFFPLPENYSNTNNSIQTKAALYGMPPYYYTQLQQQIMGLDAPYGYLSVMFESTWRVHTFFAWRDEAVIRQLILKGTEVWNRIMQLGGPASR